tara:strand:+ start:144 stop:440 length:297 start_codon:yes stop_codon:yes gene_type:complete
MSKNKRIECADGFTMSVQANTGAYCHPRVDNAEAYEEVEVGFPNRPESLLKSYAEDEANLTETVYPYVPSQVVVDVIAKHGGILSGQLPSGLPHLASR